jgi:hypothetical protein
MNTTTTTEAVTELPSRQTRAERMRQPLAADVVAAVAEQHGVCVRPFTMEVGDPDTGELRYVPMPCGSTVESVCGPCARKARALRMAQCREGWHLAEEPLFTVDEPTPEQRAQLTTRADLVAHYRDAVHHERAGDADELRETIRETDENFGNWESGAACHHRTHRPSAYQSDRPAADKTYQSCPPGRSEKPP